MPCCLPSPSSPPLATETLRKCPTAQWNRTICLSSFRPVTCKWIGTAIFVSINRRSIVLLGEGQLCSIGYATIGIPIFLLCVANISGVLGEMFRFIYGKIICRPCRMIKKRRAAARKAKLEEDIGASIDPVPMNGWSNESDANRKVSIKKPDNAMIANAPLDEGENQGRNERVAVPLTVTMIIIAAYIWIGSALFHNFEGWTMIQAGYFCFITLGKSHALSLTCPFRLRFFFQQLLASGISWVEKWLVEDEFTDDVFLGSWPTQGWS